MLCINPMQLIDNKDKKYILGFIGIIIFYFYSESKLTQYESLNSKLIELMSFESIIEN